MECQVSRIDEAKCLDYVSDGYCKGLEEVKGFVEKTGDRRHLNTRMRIALAALGVKLLSFEVSEVSSCLGFDKDNLRKYIEKFSLSMYGKELEHPRRDHGTPKDEEIVQEVKERELEMIFEDYVLLNTTDEKLCGEVKRRRQLVDEHLSQMGVTIDNQK